MKQITRTVITSTIKASQVKFLNGKIEPKELKPLTIHNREIKDETQALKEIQKEYGKDNQYVVTAIETNETTYGLDFDKFMELAVAIERPPSQQKNNKDDQKPQA